MTTTPDLATVREIAQEAVQCAARRRDYIGPALTDHDVMGVILASGDRSAWGKWNDAIRAEMEAAVVTVSWPDEQPQGDRDMCTCGEPISVCQLRTEVDQLRGQLKNEREVLTAERDEARELACVSLDILKNVSDEPLRELYGMDDFGEMPAWFTGHGKPGGKQ